MEGDNRADDQQQQQHRGNRGLPTPTLSYLGVTPTEVIRNCVLGSCALIPFPFSSGWTHPFSSIIFHPASPRPPVQAPPRRSLPPFPGRCRRRRPYRGLPKLPRGLPGHAPLLFVTPFPPPSDATAVVTRRARPSFWRSERELEGGVVELTGDL